MPSGVRTGVQIDAAISAFVHFALVFLGLWAVCIQIGVQAGITFAQTLIFLPLCLVGGLAGAWFLPTLVNADPPATRLAEEPLELGRLVRFGIAAGLILVAFVVAIGGAGLLGVNLDALFFLVLVAVLGWGLVSPGAAATARALRAGPARAVANQYPLTTLAVLLAAALLPLFSHRADLDDANFLNIATGMMADPRPILTWDTILGDPAQRIMLPSYRVEVIYALIAGLAQVTGLEVIEVAHWVWPVFAALMLVSVFYLSARTMGGPHWLVAFLASLAFLFIFGGVHHSFGNFSFVRLQQGKSLLFVAIVPLIYLFAIRFWEHGRGRDFAALALTQAAGTGLSANGVFLCPIALLLCGLGLFATDPTRPGRLVLLGLAGFWPVLAALAVLLTTGAFASEVVITPGVVDNLRDVFGAVQSLAVVPFVLAGWALLRGWTRRFYLGCTLAFALLVLNPLLNPILADTVTGNLNWRLFFALPAPLFAGLAFAALWAQVRDRVALPGKDLAAGLLVLALGAAGPASIMWQDSVEYGAFELDVDASYPVARALDDGLAPGARVLAPEEIAAWLSTMADPKALVVTRPVYLLHYRRSRPARDVALREAALELLTDGAPATAPLDEALALYVEEFEVTDVIVSRRNPRFAEFAGALAPLGLGPVRRVGDYVQFSARRLAPASRQARPPR